MTADAWHHNYRSWNSLRRFSTPKRNQALRYSITPTMLESGAGSSGFLFDYTIGQRICVGEIRAHCLLFLSLDALLLCFVFNLLFYYLLMDDGCTRCTSWISARMLTWKLNQNVQIDFSKAVEGVPPEYPIDVSMGCTAIVHVVTS